MARINTGRLNAYAVVSPPYQTYYGGYYDPPEYGCDYRLVYARTARQAIIIAVRAWRRMNKWYYYRRGPISLYKSPGKYSFKLLTSNWVKDNEESDFPPWKGIKAERLPDEEEDEG